MMHQSTACGILMSVHIGRPQTFSDDQGNWTSAIAKQPVDAEVVIGRLGVEGDAVADTKHHGGVDKAVLAYSADHYPFWQQELQVEFPLGGFGENLSVAGIDETRVCVGDRWEIGEIVVEVSQPRNPCWKLGRRWKLKQLPKLVRQTARSGWYLRVVRPGGIRAGQAASLADRPNPTWTVERAFRVFYDGLLDEKQELANLPQLSRAWQHDLVR